jgi:cytoskeleton protein RodZ
MWISYLIIAILFASTILWWVQGERKQNKEIAVTTPTQVTESITETATPTEVELSENIADNSEATNAITDQSTVVQPVLSSPLTLNEDNVSTDNIAVEETVIMLDRAVFTFSGDCWVNIFDANNERIAWGIKKLGYVMAIEGKGPFRVTIGKPELVSITFNDMPVDMTPYNSGNIAKFTLHVIEDN